MGGKYKKRLRSEKAKVKLKKKTLPKGQNITDTSFKVKKIITVEQLRKVNENEPVSSWNVPLKDLLIHLNHHSKSSRLNGLKGIREVVTNYPDVVRGSSLQHIVSKILELFTDLEPKIRSSAANLLDVLFTQLDPVQITPFYEILNVYLACTMTHRHVSIQKDSLRLIDVILDHAPQSLKQNFKVLMSNFIRILSTYKYGSQSEIFLTKGSKKDLEENRIAIFQRLNKILKIYYANTLKENDQEYKTLYYNECNGFSIRKLDSNFKRIPNLSVVFKPQISDGSSIFEDEEKDFQMLISKLMPILFETWAEFLPAKDKSGFISECFLKESTATLLSLILDIIMLLYEKNLEMETKDKRNLFQSSYGSQFVKFFLSSFPYLPQIVNKKVKSPNLETIGEEPDVYNKSYLRQNLIVCYLAQCMKLQISNELEKKLENYIMNSLLIRNVKAEEILVKVLESIFVSPFKKKKLEMFLESFIKAYKHTTNVDFQRKLLEILDKIVVDVKYEHLQGNESLSGWLVYLAKGLCKNKISCGILKTLSCAIKRKIGVEALREVENKFSEILNNLQTVEIEGCDQFEGKKCIVNILYWCDDSLIESALESGILERDFPSDLKDYLKKVFSYKKSNLSR